MKIVSLLVHLYIKRKIKRPFNLENMRKSVVWKVLKESGQQL